MATEPAPQSSPIPCEPRLLCSSAVGTVSQCAGCGQVHVSLSYLTVRLEPDAFQELTAMLAMALQDLAWRRPEGRGVTVAGRSTTELH